VPPIMLACAATAIAGACFHPLALAFAPAAYVLLASMVTIVRFGAALPGSNIGMGWFGATEAMATGAVVIAAAWAIRTGVLDRMLLWLRAAPARTSAQPSSIGEPATAPRRGRLPPGRQRTPWPIGAAALLAGIAIGAVGYARIPHAPTDLRVTYLDVGAGSAILVESAGQRVLVDGGPPGEATAAALDHALRPWQRSLSLIILTGSASSRSGGLHGVLGRYRVGAVLDGTGAGEQAGSSQRSAQAPRSAGATERVKMLTLQGPAVLRLGTSTLQLSTAGPVPRGGASEAATVAISAGARRFVLSGDTRATTPADVRSLNAANRSDPPLAARIEVLEAGPTAAADNALASVPVDLRRALLYRTTENGDVTIETDGADLRVRVAKGPRLGLFGRVR
jgi:beta-lactamase superfamily II metal-dependent hydrolase